MTGKIIRVEVDEEDSNVSFFFEDSFEPFVVGEFKDDSLTGRALARIEYDIQDYNSEIDLMRKGEGE